MAGSRAAPPPLARATGGCDRRDGRAAARGCRSRTGDAGACREQLVDLLRAAVAGHLVELRLEVLAALRLVGDEALDLEALGRLPRGLALLVREDERGAAAEELGHRRRVPSLGGDGERGAPLAVDRVDEAPGLEEHRDDRLVAVLGREVERSAAVLGAHVGHRAGGEQLRNHGHVPVERRHVQRGVAGVRRVVDRRAALHEKEETAKRA